MKIRSISIQRYRSLGDVALRPRDLTVLVGPNNAGKSNLVNAIDFLGDTYRFGLETAMARKGGFENIAFRRQRRTKANIHFAIDAVLTTGELRRWMGSRLPKGVEADWEIQVLHSFSLQVRRGIEADYRVTEEIFEVTAPQVLSGHPLLRLEFAGGELRTAVTTNLDGAFWSRVIFPYGDKRFSSDARRTKVVDTDLFVTSRNYFGSVSSVFTRHLATAQILRVSSESARQAGVSTPNPELGEHGENLPGYIRLLRRSPQAWNNVLDLMRRVVPGLDDIRPGFGYGNRLTLRFYERGLNRPWTTDEMSDGTLHVLALLTGLNDPRSRLVLLEEPENSIHPWVIRNFIESCRAVEDKQVILTTHSPTVLDACSPEEVVVVSREGGVTRVRDLPEVAPETVGLWSTGQAKLSEMLDAGLVPQAVPLH